MKKLLAYLNAIPVEAREPFAAKCGTSFDYLRQIGYGNRACTEGLAIELERETGRALTCEELCPKADWAFIRASAASPPRSAPGPEVEPERPRRNPPSPEKMLTLGRS